MARAFRNLPFHRYGIFPKLGLHSQNLFIPGLCLDIRNGQAPKKGCQTVRCAIVKGMRISIALRHPQLSLPTSAHYAFR